MHYHHNHVLVHFIASVTENLGLKKSGFET